MKILLAILICTILLLTWRVIYIQYKIEDMCEEQERKERQEKEKAPRN